MAHTPRVETRRGASLRDGLLRLMSAGLVHLFFRDAGFCLQFVLSEATAWLLKQGMEVMHMTKGPALEITSYVTRRLSGGDAARQECPIPTYRLSLLTSP